LLALDAEVELTSRAGTRRVALAEFITGNRRTVRRSNELLTAVLVPRVLENGASAFVKLGARRYLVISIAMVAAVVRPDATGRVAEARIAVGSCSVVARRLVALERELVGAEISSGFDGRVRREHLQPLSPIDDVRATAEYRMDAAQTLVERALNLCVGIA
jgi:CO/xanthine dehydrogenase FAD-binding subunit